MGHLTRDLQTGVYREAMPASLAHPYLFSLMGSPLPSVGGSQGRGKEIVLVYMLVCEMLWEHKPQASVSTAFSSSPKLSQVFL